MRSSYVECAEPKKLNSSPYKNNICDIVNMWLMNNSDARNTHIIEIFRNTDVTDGGLYIVKNTNLCCNNLCIDFKPAYKPFSSLNTS